MDASAFSNSLKHIIFEKAIIFGEGYGKGIQKVGALYADEQKFIMFDILIVEEESAYWIPQFSMMEIGKELGLDTVPMLPELKTSEEVVKMTKEGFKSQLSELVTKAEGFILRPNPSLMRYEERSIYKIKHKDFSK